MVLKASIYFGMALAILIQCGDLHRHGHDISTEDPDVVDRHDNITHRRKVHGGWSQWSEWSLCSRTCDGGISRQLRTCSSPKGCRGEPVRFKICNTQPCRANTSLLDEDMWREEQCAAHDNTPYGGELFHWRAARDDTNPCALTCRGAPQHSGQKPDPTVTLDDDDRVVVAVLAGRVVDGTRCRPGNLDMCIDGRCQRVGCDLRVGSTRRVDECGVCGGNGSSCSRPRYHWLSIPGSLCSVTCGGGFKMSLAVCRDRLTGLDAPGQLCDESRKPMSAVSACNIHPCPFKWYVGEWTPCSVSCGGGMRSRRVLCARSANATAAHTYQPGMTDEPGCMALQPESTQPCNEHACPVWYPGIWSGCSVSCGDGIQVRGVECSPVGSNCDPITRPLITRPCSTGISCPITYKQSYRPIDEDFVDIIQPLIQARTERLTRKKSKTHLQTELPTVAQYVVGTEYSECSVTCGEGLKRKSVRCMAHLASYDMKVIVPEHLCEGPKPKGDPIRCIMEPCTMALEKGDGYGDDRAYGVSNNIRVASSNAGITYSWKVTGFTSCSATCLSGVQEMIIQCIRDADGKNASPYMCDPSTKPENRVKTCNDVACPPRWNYTKFTECSKSCGMGYQTREVYCVREVTLGAGMSVVPHDQCPQPIPTDRQYCNVLDCPTRWFTHEWGECSVTCGRGAQERPVVCQQILAQEKVVERDAAHCIAAKPATIRECIMDPCIINTGAPVIVVSKTTYIQHDPKMRKVTLRIGSNATLFTGTIMKIKCPVKKFNRTKVFWAKDSSIIHKIKSYKYKQSNNGAIRVMNLTFRDAGVYTCIAGDSRANLTLVVKQRPGGFPSSEEIERRKSVDGSSSPLSGSRTDSRYRAVIGGSADDRSHEQRPGEHRKNYKNKSGKHDKARDALYGSAVTTSTKASPYVTSQTKDIQKGNEGEPGIVTRHTTSSFKTILTLGSSRGQRMANYGAENNPEVVTLEVIPQDDGSDIIVVNEDSIPQKTIKDYGSENTTVKAVDAYIDSEYEWVTTDWSPCDAPCGQSGYQLRGTSCQKTDNFKTTVEVTECERRGLSPPAALQQCDGPCGMWRLTDCSDICLPSGIAVFRCRVECINEQEAVLPESSCNKKNKPLKNRRLTITCKAGWRVGPWSKCVGACGDIGRQHRLLRCVWRVGMDNVGMKKIEGKRARAAGAACAFIPRPAVERACDVPSCTNKDGDCRDTSRFCENVRGMQMCALRRFKTLCCKTCGGF